eukprot:4610881-Pyramimonas_sp.AAC.2
MPEKKLPLGHQPYWLTCWWAWTRRPLRTGVARRGGLAKLRTEQAETSQEERGARFAEAPPQVASNRGSRG